MRTLTILPPFHSKPKTLVPYLTFFLFSFLISISSSLLLAAGKTLLPLDYSNSTLFIISAAASLIITLLPVVISSVIDAILWVRYKLFSTRSPSIDNSALENDLISLPSSESAADPSPADMISNTTSLSYFFKIYFSQGRLSLWLELPLFLAILQVPFYVFYLFKTSAAALLLFFSLIFLCRNLSFQTFYFATSLRANESEEAGIGGGDAMGSIFASCLYLLSIQSAKKPKFEEDKVVPDTFNIWMQKASLLECVFLSSMMGIVCFYGAFRFLILPDNYHELAEGGRRGAASAVAKKGAENTGKGGRGEENAAEVTGKGDKTGKGDRVGSEESDEPGPEVSWGRRTLDAVLSSLPSLLAHTFVLYTLKYIMISEFFISTPTSAFLLLSPTVKNSLCYIVETLGSLCGKAFATWLFPFSRGVLVFQLLNCVLFGGFLFVLRTGRVINIFVLLTMALCAGLFSGVYYTKMLGVMGKKNKKGVQYGLFFMDAGTLVGSLVAVTVKNWALNFSQTHDK